MRLQERALGEADEGHAGIHYDRHTKAAAAAQEQKRLRAQRLQQKVASKSKKSTQGHCSDTVEKVGLTNSDCSPCKESTMHSISCCQVVLAAESFLLVG